MADNNENSTRNLFAEAPLATDSSGNLTPEAIAALLAQNSEPEQEVATAEEENIEDDSESEVVDMEESQSDSALTNLENSEAVEVETSSSDKQEEMIKTESESVEIESSDKQLEAAKPESVEVEPEQETAIAESDSELESPTENSETEIESASAPLSTDSSGNLTPEAIAALLAQNSDINLKPEIAEAIADLLVKNSEPETDVSAKDEDELQNLMPEDIIPSTMSPGESGDGVLSNNEAAALEADLINEIFMSEESSEPISQEQQKDSELSESETEQEIKAASGEIEESDSISEKQHESFDALGKRIHNQGETKKDREPKSEKSILAKLLGVTLIVPALLTKLKSKSKKKSKAEGQTKSPAENSESEKPKKPRGFLAKLSKNKKVEKQSDEDSESPSPAKKKKAKKKKTKPKKKPKKKKAKQKKSKKQTEGDGSNKKKKLVIIAAALIVALGASAFAAMKLGFIDIGKVSSKSSSDSNGPVGEILEEEKQDYKQPNVLRFEGMDESADWFKVNFSKRYGLQNEDGLFEVLSLNDEDLKVARSAAAEEILTAKSILSEKAASPTDDSDSKGENKSESKTEKKKSEDKKSDKSDKKKDTGKDKDSDKAKSSEDKDDKSEDKKAEEKEPGKKELAAKAVIKAEDNARNWAYYSASINAYNTIGTEGFKFLNNEFLRRQNENQVYSLNYSKYTEAMLFSSVNDFKIKKTLIASDYNKAYVEFTRNVNVQRLADPSILMETFLDGVIIGAENPQRFGMELTYDEKLKDFRVNNIYRMEVISKK